MTHSFKEWWFILYNALITPVVYLLSESVLELNPPYKPAVFWLASCHKPEMTILGISAFFDIIQRQEYKNLSEMVRSQKSEVWAFFLTDLLTALQLTETMLNFSWKTNQWKAVVSCRPECLYYVTEQTNSVK